MRASICAGVMGVVAPFWAESECAEGVASRKPRKGAAGEDRAEKPSGEGIASTAGIDEMDLVTRRIGPTSRGVNCVAAFRAERDDAVTQPLPLDEDLGRFRRRHRAPVHEPSELDCLLLVQFEDCRVRQRGLDRPVVVAAFAQIDVAERLLAGIRIEEAWSVSLNAG